MASNHRFTRLGNPILSTAVCLLTAAVATSSGQVLGDNVYLTLNIGVPFGNPVFKYDNQGSGGFLASTGLVAPYGIVSDSAGNVYVANGGNTDGSITRFTPDGNRSVFATGAVSGSRSFGLAMDAAGNLFATTGSGIDKITPDGTRTSFVDFGSQVLARDLEVAPNGDLLVVQAQTGKVVRVTPAGTVTDFATITSDPNELYGIAIDSSGLVYVGLTVSNAIERYSAEGSSLGTFVSSGLAAPTGLDFDANGNLFVANIGGFIQKFDPAGNGSRFVTGPGPDYNVEIPATAAAVPEASTWAAAGLLGFAVGMGFWRRARGRAQAST